MMCDIFLHPVFQYDTIDLIPLNEYVFLFLTQIYYNITCDLYSTERIISFDCSFYVGHVE